MKNSDKSIKLSISDHSALHGLADHLSYVAPSAQISVVPGEPGDGELGAEDVLMVVAGSPVLIAAIRTLPEFLRDRRSKPSASITVKDKTVIMTPDDLDDVMQVLDKLLDE